MDGYAIRFADCTTSPRAEGQSTCEQEAPTALPARTARLRILGTIAAGDMPSISVEPGSTLRIMTGAPMPAGADTVVMRENVTVETDAPVTGTITVDVDSSEPDPSFA